MIDSHAAVAAPIFAIISYFALFVQKMHLIPSKTAQKSTITLLSFPIERNQLDLNLISAVSGCSPQNQSFSFSPKNNASATFYKIKAPQL